MKSVCLFEKVSQTWVSRQRPRNTLPRLFLHTSKIFVSSTAASLFFSSAHNKTLHISARFLCLIFQKLLYFPVNEPVDPDSLLFTYFTSLSIVKVKVATDYTHQINPPVSRLTPNSQFYDYFGQNNRLSLTFLPAVSVSCFFLNYYLA